jgi:transcriptional regulator with XRE-family HTH domain
MVHKNNLLAHRKRWALSQPALAKLLGVSAVALSRYATRNRAPHLRIDLGLEVVFGVPARALFPDRYADVEAAVHSPCGKPQYPIGGEPQRRGEGAAGTALADERLR